MRGLSLIAVTSALGLAGCWLTQSTEPLRGESCADADVLLCEDFEMPLDPADWRTNLVGVASAVPDGAHAHRGQLSLHAHTNAFDGSNTQPTAQAIYHFTNPLPPTFYVRVFVYVPAASFALPTTTFEAATFVGSTIGAAPWDGMGVGLRANAMLDWLTWASSTQPVQAEADNGVLRVDDWTCVELGVDGAETTVWIDGADAPALSASEPQSLKLMDVQFGWQLQYFGPMFSAYDVWIDDVMIDTKRIGCTS